MPVPFATRSRRPAALALGLLLLALACAPDATPTVGHTSVVAAGDIAGCWWRADEATARLLDHIGGVVMPLGDAVYQDGSAQQFTRCYAPTWGRHLARTRPVLGNHDYRSEHGKPYFAYFGAAAGEAGKGWYSFEHEGWHVVVLNSETTITPGSEQLQWLRRDLAAHPTRCTLAAMHRPRFSSGVHGDSRRVREAFRILYEGGVDVLISGHDHVYERFIAQDTLGRADPARGIRQFVVGTGGAPFYDFRDTILAHSEVHQNRMHGVLRLVFHPAGYQWEFVGTGNGFHDQGQGVCH